MVVYLTLAIKMGESGSINVVPVVDCFDPVIDGVIFRMLGYHFRLSTDVGPNPGIAKLPLQKRQSAIRPR